MVEIARVDASRERFGDRFLKRVFTEAERRYCEERKGGAGQSFALRFAAKEAVAKAIGTGIRRGVDFKDIEVVSDSLGRPSIALHGLAAAAAKKRGIRSLHLSLSHDGPLAVAFAVAEGAQAPAKAARKRARRR